MMNFVTVFWGKMVEWWAVKTLASKKFYYGFCLGAFVSSVLALLF
jgi:hypothetical protein